MCLRINSERVGKVFHCDVALHKVDSAVSLLSATSALALRSLRYRRLNAEAAEDTEVRRENRIMVGTFCATPCDVDNAFSVNSGGFIEPSGCDNPGLALANAFGVC